MKKSFRILSAILSIVIFGIFIVARIAHGPFGAMIKLETMVSDEQFLLTVLMFWTLLFSLFTEISVFYDKKMTPLLRVMTTICFIFSFIFINQIGAIISTYSNLCVILIVVAGGFRILAEIISIKDKS